ncbi:MAG: hypothetical protein F4W92_08125 [Gammaproteobacteria bacterium]|nr:hypothetical protein [Gammaproteobacteria bacterium]
MQEASNSDIKDWIMYSKANKHKRTALAGGATVFVLFGVCVSHDISSGLIALGESARAQEVQDSAQDREALEAIYHATGGDEWKHNEGWLTKAPLEDWYGLRLNNGRVIYLELNDNNLTGEIPEDINSLEELAVLDLRWNSLTGGLENLKDLPKIRVLKLSANNFSGAIPASMGTLDSIQVLDLSENEFSGSIPNELGGLINLEAFAAHNNVLEGEYPKRLCDIQSLRRVVLSDNNLSGSISDLLLNCEGLQHIHLANNSFEGAVPTRLPSSEQVNWLDLRGNNIDEKIYTVLQINFPGILIQTDQIGEINGLTVWGRGSFTFFHEQFRLVSLRYLNAISVEDGRLRLAEPRVPSELLDQAKDSIDFVNMHLDDSSTQIQTVSDLERFLAKAEKRALTNQLKNLGSKHNVIRNDYFEAPDEAIDKHDSTRQPLKPDMFVVDVASSKLIFRHSQSHDDLQTSKGLSEDDDSDETMAPTSESKSSSLRFTAKLSMSELNFLIDGAVFASNINYKYIDGEAGRVTINFYCEIHHLQEFFGVVNVTSGSEFPHMIRDVHPASEDTEMNVVVNLNLPGYYFARLTATPRYRVTKFEPTFVMVESLAQYFSN